MDGIKAIESERRKLRKACIIMTVNDFNNAWYNKLLRRRITLRDGVRLAKTEGKSNWWDSCWLWYDGQRLDHLRSIAKMCLRSESDDIVLDQEAVSVVFR